MSWVDYIQNRKNENLKRFWIVKTACISFRKISKKQYREFSRNLVNAYNSTCLTSTHDFMKIGSLSGKKYGFKTVEILCTVQ